MNRDPALANGIHRPATPVQHSDEDYGKLIPALQRKRIAAVSPRPKHIVFPVEMAFSVV